MLPQLPQSFQRKKSKILSHLSIPASEYDDLSPKGSVDIQIRDLIDEINGVEGLVTTSSCAGRVSVFLEGEKRSLGRDEELNNDGIEDGMGGGEEMRAKVTSAGTGGKGGGGRWLFVSHDPIVVSEMGEDATAFLGLKRREALKGEEMAGRRVHFKYEGFILHVLTSSLANAQIVLQAAMQAGFRESGALNLISTTADAPTPMVAVRSQGMSLESIIGCAIGDEEVCTVGEANVRDLVNLANERFVENTRRIERFRTLLREGLDRGGSTKRGKDGGVWEDADVRRERNKAEGLRIREEVRKKKEALAREKADVADETE